MSLGETRVQQSNTSRVKFKMKKDSNKVESFVKN